ncbi:hypothetical protein [Roseibium sp. MMSF_3544]|uniref:hypothetical protein n=1 Tax=unclassified Roseibium TaxID=2629323 RepID=UPI0027402909|nr:hypothetical protein [Roseibium sp. MMSF_3544]
MVSRFDKSPSRAWRALLLLCALSFLAQAQQPAAAQSGRPDTRKLTCSQAQDLVKQRGSVIMTTGPTTFDTFIADVRYCMPQTNQMRPKFAPTLDNPKCAVGNRCFRSRNNR